MPPYTVGTVHALSGAGQVAVAAPAGLRIHATAYPAWVAFQPGHPDRALSLGRFSLGDGTAWIPEREIVHLDQLEWPAPPGMTQLGYSLDAGVSVEIAELASIAAAAPASWLDRNPASTTWSQLYYAAPSTSDTLAWQITVPAGKRLILQSARVQLQVLGNAGAYGAGAAGARIVLAGAGNLAQLTVSGPTGFAQDALIGELVLPQFSVVQGYYSNGISTTGYYITFAYAGVQIDA